MNTPEQPRKLSRRAFIGGAAAAGLAAIVGCKTGESSTPPPSTIKDTIPTTTSIPGTTSTTEAPNTTEPATTLPERVFASPEQKAQVEAVEGNMKKFFDLTQADIDLYKNETHFVPDPNGFSTVLVLANPDIFSARVLAVNLGTYSFPAGDGTSIASVFGCITRDGQSFVATQTAIIRDSTFLKEKPNYEKNIAANVLNPTDSGSFGTTSDYEFDSLVERTAHGLDGVTGVLNETVGQPFNFEVTADSVYLQNSTGNPVKPNPFLKQVIEGFFTPTTLAETYSANSDEDLSTIGVFKKPGLIPQTLLDGFPTMTALFAGLPLSAHFTLYNNIPKVIQ